MVYFNQFLNNKFFWTAILAWFIAQLLKFIFVFASEKKFNFERFVGAGGMPSSHSAIVTALAFIIGFSEGFDSVYFALSICFAAVVMYDAAGVRRAAGKQAKVLNQIIEHWNDDEGQEIQDERLKELLGHTPYEVIAGALLGISVAVFMYFIVL